MIKIASISFAAVTLAMSALAAHADSETIGHLTGAIGGPQWARSSQQQSFGMLGPQSEPRSAFAYGHYPEGTELTRGICNHVGGPKNGTWSCR